MFLRPTLFLPRTGGVGRDDVFVGLSSLTSPLSLPLRPYTPRLLYKSQYLYEVCLRYNRTVRYFDNVSCFPGVLMLKTGISNCK